MSFDSHGVTVDLPLKDRMLIMNPNKYLFPISSAPISVVNGVPKFTAEPAVVVMVLPKLMLIR